jgi:hypothetical protein
MICKQEVGTPGCSLGFPSSLEAGLLQRCHLTPEKQEQQLYNHYVPNYNVYRSASLNEYANSRFINRKKVGVSKYYLHFGQCFT